MRTIRTAEEAYFAQNNNYATEAQLVPNFMSELSALHDVTPDNAATPKTFAITNVAPC